MFTAMCELAESRRPAQTEIIFAGLVDEESGQAGSRALAASGFKADLAIVGEPTREQVVTAHKGDLWLNIHTRGKAVHGSRPELGKNAVHEMARVVALLETTYAAKLKRKSHPLLGHPTVNVGLIHGGTQPNIVPDHCAISIDRRTLPGETESSVRREITSLLRENGINATIENGKQTVCLPLQTNPNSGLAAQFIRSAGQRGPVGVWYFCDASVLAHHGIPSVVFGPGDIAQAHTRDEWISLASLERARALLLRFLQSLP
jgi:acetylornithine deacetylase/succinyl-diaminopimelate desuccinylase-like protein